ncbi:MAG: hypothetical protein BYD32DRAFT_194325 [Podila humilis]|nr:MAG: hypothetical protein BYD32DRAFT_194325 [Podila humilis]
MARTTKPWNRRTKRAIHQAWTILAVVVLLYSSCIVSVSASGLQAVDTWSGALPDTNARAWVLPTQRKQDHPQSLPPISAPFALAPPGHAMPAITSLDHRIPGLQERGVDSGESVPVPGVANDIALPLKAFQALAAVNSSTMLCNGRSDICDLRYNQVARFFFFSFPMLMYFRI